MYAPPQVQIGLEASQKRVNYFLRVASPGPYPTNPEQSNVSEIQKNQKVGLRPGDAPFFEGARMRTAPEMSYDLPTKALLENDIWLQN